MPRESVHGTHRLFALIRFSVTTAVILSVCGIGRAQSSEYNNGQIMQEVAKLTPADMPTLISKADQNDREAQLLIGLAYRFGKGIQQDNMAAAKWLTKAAESGVASAGNDVGVMYQMDIGVIQSDSEAVKWFQQAAEEGDAAAQANLGFMYAQGRGIKRDDSVAVTWFRKAAAQNYVDGFWNLALMYADGRGVMQDQTEAVKLFKQAAQLGSAEAQFRLGGAYLSGEGIDADDTEAIVWLRRAASDSQKNAAAVLDLIQKAQTHNPETDFESLSSMRKAAAAGGSKAQSKFGSLLLLAGQKVSACTWFVLAARQGQKNAKEILKALPKTGIVTKSEIADAERRANSWKPAVSGSVGLENPQPGSSSVNRTAGAGAPVPVFAYSSSGPGGRPTPPVSTEFQEAAGPHFREAADHDVR